MYDHTLYHISGHLAYFTRFYFCMSGINQKRISHQTVAAKFWLTCTVCISVIDFLDGHVKQISNLEDCKLDQEK